MQKLFHFTLLAFIGMQLQAQFPVFTHKAIEDTWINQAYPDSNFNHTWGMDIMTDRENKSSQAYIKFNVSDIQPGDSVVLVFLGGERKSRDDNNVPGEGYLLKVELSEDISWKEEDLTWDNKPRLKTQLLATYDIRSRTENGYMYVSDNKLTSTVNNAILKGPKQFTLIVSVEKNIPGTGAWVANDEWIAPSLYFFNKTGDIKTPVITPSTGYYPAGKVKIISDLGTMIFYTLDRTSPDQSSKEYKKPFFLERDAVVTAIAYKNKEKSLFAREFIFIGDMSPVSLEVDLTHEKRSLKSVWKSTGFSPAEFFLRPDMQQTFDYQGTVPNVAVQYVRPHYLLNLLGVEGIETETPRYNWSKLDEALDALVKNDLKLIFEIMGTPSSSVTDLSSQFDANYQAQLGGHETFFTNFRDSVKVYAWKRLVKDLAAHLIERYGQAEVRSWYFETSNEPDIRTFWKHSIEEFNNYYDACSEALLEVDPNIRFGGPGSAGDLSEIFRSIVAHCDTGVNYFTGEKGVRMDFISFHVKDMPRRMIEREKRTISYVLENHPRFSNMLFINDEADPLVGWKADLWWRSGPWYAAFIAQSADLHDRVFIDSMGLNYGFVSNDNAFMGTWGNRTQLARFINPDDPGSISMIKKPVFTVTSMLGMLGRMRIDAAVPKEYSSHLGIIPTIHADGKIAVLIYNKAEIVSLRRNKPVLEDDGIIASESKTVILALKNLPLNEYTMVHYRIDDTTSNPYHTWLETGKPHIPSTEQLSLLRNAQELASVCSPQAIAVTENSFTKEIEMPASSVSLIILAPRSFSEPDTVEKLSLKKYKGVNGETDIMLKWYYPAQNVHTFEVWYTPDMNKEFSKINQVNLIDRAYIHSITKQGSKGYYKVRAIDYWGKKGEFSEIVGVN